MRIWYGKEMEGQRVGVPTIFVEAAFLEDAEEIIDKIKDLPIKRLYFGAGRKDIISFPKGFFETFKERGYEIIIESSCRNTSLSRFLETGVDEVVVRLDIKSTMTPAKLTFKTDDEREAIIYRPDTITSLEAVKDGLYSNQDTILWEE